MVLAHFRFVSIGGPCALSYARDPSVALSLLMIILFIGALLFGFLLYRQRLIVGSVSQ